jgi:two-component system cell cycle response regulator
MKKISTVQVIDTLALITRHHDRELLEKSLISTLAELLPSQEFRLYRVLAQMPNIEIALLSLARKGHVITPMDALNNPVSERLVPAILKSVRTAAIVQSNEQGNGAQHLIYPVFDKNDTIHGVLVQTTEQASIEDQRFTHGLLKIYSNYLILLEESQKDKLTQLLNRETLDREITRTIMAYAKKSQRQRQTGAQRADDNEQYWLCVADLDYFKRINDQFGHLYGDEVLILFSRLLKCIFREEDQIYRYGGEEFITIFKTRSQQAAQSVCERLRSTVANHVFPRIGQVTVSIGVVEITDQEGTSGVIDQADQALYFAKEHGRNQVHFHGDLLAAGLLKPLSEESNAVDFF